MSHFHFYLCLPSFSFVARFVFGFFFCLIISLVGICLLFLLALGCKRHTVFSACSRDTRGYAYKLTSHSCWISSYRGNFYAFSFLMRCQLNFLNREDRRTICRLCCFLFSIYCLYLTIRAIDYPVTHDTLEGFQSRSDPPQSNWILLLFQSSHWVITLYRINFSRDSHYK